MIKKNYGPTTYSAVIPYLPSCYIYIFLQTTTVTHGRCTNDFEGTSAATPLAAGVIALMLEAKYVHAAAELASFPNLPILLLFFVQSSVCFW